MRNKHMWYLVNRVCSRRLTIAAPLVCIILHTRQVRIIEMSYDDDNNSVVVFAGTDKSPDMFEAVLSGIEKDLTPQEVRNNEW